MNADRNVLFGILAFQNNFIDRRVLLASFDGWTADKSTSFGEILLDQGAIDSDSHSLLEAIVAKHLKLHGGDPEKSLAAVSSLSSVRKDLEQIGDPDVEASLTHLPAPNPAEDPYATRTACVNEVSEPSTSEP